jgi:hypothetical protein
MIGEDLTKLARSCRLFQEGKQDVAQSGVADNDRGRTWIVGPAVVQPKQSTLWRPKARRGGKEREECVCMVDVVVLKDKY